MTRRTIEIAASCIALLVAAMSVHAWLASRDEQQRLASTLAAQKQLLDAADTRERARQSALDDTLAQIESLKRATQTPAEILRDLPKFLPLPQPITLTPAGTSGSGARGAGVSAAPAAGQGIDVPTKIVTPRDSASAEKPRDLSGPGASAAKKAASGQPEPPNRPSAARSADLPSAPAAQIPSVDLKPLFDYVQDCRACQAQLAAARQNASDDATKLAALARERDAAITASKGGTFWRRLRRNAEWFGVGAALGAAAGYATAKQR
jgi:hypothetical protein